MRFGSSTALALVVGAAIAPGQSSRPTDQNSFFGLGRLWRVDLKVAAADWDSLYPQRRPRIGLSMRGQFGYTRANVRIAGHELRNVGIRFKGNSTFWTTGGSLKRPFKLDFDRFVGRQRFLGLRKLNLQNNATDPSQLREAVSYRAYRRSGLAASRTCFARVYLTIPGRVDGEYLGLYTITEQVDRDFLQRCFGSRKGLIVKPEGHVLAYLGDAWDELYDAIYVPKTVVDHEAADKVIALARLVDGAAMQPGEIRERVADSLDVDSFLRYVAVTTILVNQDNPLTIPHNFYLAVPARTRRVVWIPWDLNLSLGGFRMMGGGRPDTSVTKPSRAAVVAKLFAVPELFARYKEICRELIEGPCSARELTASIKLARKTIRTAIADEAKRSEAVTKVAEPGSRFRPGLGRLGETRTQRAVDRATESLLDFVERRERNVRDQLDGKTEGRVIFRGAFQRWGQSTGNQAAVRLFFVRMNTLDLDGDSRLSKDDLRGELETGFVTLDANESGSLERKEVEAEARRQPSRWAAFQQRTGAAVAARRIWLRLDRDRDGRVTRAEWDGAMLAALTAADSNGDGVWTRRELTRGR